MILISMIVAVFRAKQSLLNSEPTFSGSTEGAYIGDN